jgi:chemotaxis protein MotA
MKSRDITIISIASIFVYWGFWNLLSYLIGDSIPLLYRICILAGGNLLGIIQSLSFGVFLYALLQIQKYRKEITEQFEGFTYKILPPEDIVAITPQEVNKIKLDIIYLEKQGIQNELNEFIKKACTQYKNENSISETLHVLDSHINNKKEIKESDLENIRYAINLNMSLGFIGTLIGLSTAIGKAYLSKTDEGLTELTSYLNTAFDTTLIALFFGIIINFGYHQYIKDLDQFYAKAKTFIVDNLVSKIYNK